jgi:hypothetical protein
VKIEGLAVPADCGEGWRKLIEQLDRDIRALSPDYRPAQVKEKFGGLRFYIDTLPGVKYETVSPLIREAEQKSYEICEVCGEPGRLRERRGWMKTLCDKHDAGFQAGTPGWALE